MGAVLCCNPLVEQLAIEHLIIHCGSVLHSLTILLNPIKRVHLVLSGYKSGKGCSGQTYQAGVKEATRRTNPAIVIFENVTGVADRSRDSKGKVREPAIEAGFLCSQYQRKCS